MTVKRHDRSRAVLPAFLGALATVGLSTAALAQQTLEGRLTVLVVDYQDGRWAEEYVLIEQGTGRPVRLDLRRLSTPDREGWAALAGSQVQVRGVPELPPGASEPRWRVDNMSRLPGPLLLQAIGSQPTVTILCQFPDVPPLTYTRPQYERVRGPVFPGVADFLATVSAGQMSLAGSQVLDWVTAPFPLTHYFRSKDDLEVGSGFTSDYTRNLTLAQHCAAAAQAAGAIIPAGTFTGVDIQLNAYLASSYAYLASVEGFPAGGPLTGRLRLAIHASWASTESGTVAHEYGHTFGLRHAGSTYDLDYDSRWDVMSNARSGRDTPSGLAFGTHYNGYGQAMQGWIPASRRVVPPVGLTEYTLAPLGTPSLPGVLLIEVPLPASTVYYTVEARRQTTAYESALPANGVIIHRVSGGRSYLIDSDNNRNPNDAGAVLIPGERFGDSQARISVEVRAESNGAYHVRIGRSATPSIESALVRPTAVEGFPYEDQLTCAGCTGAESWSLTSGRVPIGLSLSSSGQVTGMPGVPGTYMATIGVNEGGMASKAEFTWTVVDGVVITSDSLRPTGTSGTPFADTLRATSPKGPILWDLDSGALPPGLSLDRTRGVVFGIPGIAHAPARVTIVAIAGAAHRVRTFVYDVRRPVLEVTAVRDFYLSGLTSALTTNEQVYLDLLGNSNGRADLGDIRAWLVETGRLPRQASTRAVRVP